MTSPFSTDYTACRSPCRTRYDPAVPISGLATGCLAHGSAAIRSRFSRRRLASPRGMAPNCATTCGGMISATLYTRYQHTRYQRAVYQASAASGYFRARCGAAGIMAPGWFPMRKCVVTQRWRRVDRSHPRMPRSRIICALQGLDNAPRWPRAAGSGLAAGAGPDAGNHRVHPWQAFSLYPACLSRTVEEVVGRWENDPSGEARRPHLLPRPMEPDLTENNP